MRRGELPGISLSSRSFCVAKAKRAGNNQTIGSPPADSKGPTLSDLVVDSCAHLAYRISRISTFSERCPSSRRSGKRNKASHSNGRRQRAIFHRASLPVQRSALSDDPFHLEGPAAASKSECGSSALRMSSMIPRRCEHRIAPTVPLTQAIRIPGTPDARTNPGFVHPPGLGVRWTTLWTFSVVSAVSDQRA
jgi:hypothetical protein